MESQFTPIPYGALRRREPARGAVLRRAQLLKRVVAGVLTFEPSRTEGGLVRRTDQNTLLALCRSTVADTGVDPTICLFLQSGGARSSNRRRQVRKTESEL